MEIEDALGLVEEIKNCSLPWDDVHWEALGTVINYVRDKLNEDSKNTWKPSDEQVKALGVMTEYCDIATSFDAYKQRIVESLYNDLKKLKRRIKL